MKRLKEMYSIHSPSGREGAIIRFIAKWIKNNVVDAQLSIDHENNNIYITRGKSETYPCVVAHLDQVQKRHSKDFVAVEDSDIIFGYSPKFRRQEGLGADDKNGIWIALKMIEKYDVIKVALFGSEEVGCIGSSNADMSFFDNVRFVIEADRRGYKDMVTSIGMFPLCSPEFIQDAKPEMFGYAECDGMMTDVLALKENGLSVSCINLSCGYYAPHTDVEYTCKSDLMNCKAFVEYIIENLVDVYPHSPEDEYNFFEEDIWEVEEAIWNTLDTTPIYDWENIYSAMKPLYPKMSKSLFDGVVIEYKKYTGWI